MKTKRIKPTLIAAMVAMAFGSSLQIAEAGNYCGLGIPGLGCGNNSGMTDSTGSGWVGPAEPLIPGGGVIPSQNSDAMAQAIMQAENGQLPVYWEGYYNNPPPAGFQNVVQLPYTVSRDPAGGSVPGISDTPFLATNGSQFVLDFYESYAATTGGGGGGSTVNTCFPAGALVLMADGSERLIETIRPGEWLMGADGVPVQIHQVDRPVLGPRRMLAMADSSLLWSEEHGMWTRDAKGDEWWWSANPDAWRAEVEDGAIGGLRDNASMRTGAGHEFAHLSGWRGQEVVEAKGFGPETLLFLPMTHGVPIIVNGYVVGAGVNEHAYDYGSFRWGPAAVAERLAQQALARVMRRRQTHAARFPELMA